MENEQEQPANDIPVFVRAQQIIEEYESGEREFSWIVLRAYWQITDE